MCTYGLSRQQPNQVRMEAWRISSRCLIDYHATHPGAGFPASLDALPHDLQLPQGTVCNATIAGDGAVPSYTFTYTPLGDSSNPVFTDFRLLAMPLRKGVPRVDPIAVDSWGRIFSYIGWSMTDQGPSFVPTLVEAPDDFQTSHILISVRKFDYSCKQTVAPRQQCSRRSVSIQGKC